MRTALDVDIEAAQRAMWDHVSAGWERWDGVVERMLGPVTEAMIRSLGIRPDQHHLDVAAGTGQPGLTIAQVAPAGRVVLTDLAPRMLAAARRLAEATGIDNIETHVCSADRLPFDDATFDSATCRFGLMFVPRPGRAVAEMARVVRPGGRVAMSVWAAAADNPWATLAASAIAAVVPPPPSDADAPGMFRCALPGAVSALAHGAGLCEIAEWDVAVALTASADEYWQMITEVIAPVAAELGHLDEATRERIATSVKRASTPFQSSGALRLPGLSRTIVATKREHQVR